MCALGRAGTFDAQTIKQAKQNELSQLEAAEEGSCNSSGCTSRLKFSLWCEQLIYELEEKTGVCLWVHNHVCVFYTQCRKSEIIFKDMLETERKVQMG